MPNIISDIITNSPGFWSLECQVGREMVGVQKCHGWLGCKNVTLRKRIGFPNDVFFFFF